MPLVIHGECRTCRIAAFDGGNARNGRDILYILVGKSIYERNIEVVETIRFKLVSDSLLIALSESTESKKESHPESDEQTDGDEGYLRLPYSAQQLYEPGLFHSYQTRSVA